MGRFVVRRLLQMILVLFAVSVLTFLIFNVRPNSDPAVRMSGRQASESTIQAIRKEWGFNDPLWQQYLTTMKKVFTGDLKSEFTQLPVGEEIRKGLPRTFSLAIGAALLWMFVAVCFGLYSAVKAGKFADRFLTIIALVGISMPVFWIGALMNYYLGFRLGWFPNGGYVEFTEDPIDRAGDPVHRLLLARAALERAGHDQRGFRAHRPGEGPRRAPDPDPPRAAQLDDPDCDAVGPRLRGRARRRHHPHPGDQPDAGHSRRQHRTHPGPRPQAAARDPRTA